MNALKENMNVPQHIAIIMDGNGRWAKQRNKTRIEGHKRGANQIKKVLDGARKFGVKYITLYAFSSENWNRPKVEVSALMHLLEKSIKANEKDFIKNEVRFETIGDISALPSYCQKAIAKIKKSTQHFNKQTLILALNYGSRDEITRVVKKLITSAINKEITLQDISWQRIQENLDTANFPDPDMVIRTSGEQRLSNYLMLQSAYAELYFTNVNWPDFDEEHLLEAIQEYSSRERRYGLTSEQIQEQC